VGRVSPKKATPGKVEFSKEVSFTFVSRISEHGGALRLRLPRQEARFFNLEPGDVVHCSVDHARGVRDAHSAKIRDDPNKP
jgi:hypothetical protein